MQMKGRNSTFVALSVLFVAVLVRYHHEIITAAAFVLGLSGVWAYHTSPLYLAYLKSEWDKLEPVDAVPLPEIQAANFTQELLWELTNDFRQPVIIRGAISDTVAFRDWGKNFFVEHYGDELVMVREMLDDTKFRVVRAPMKEFWQAYDSGRNVSIFTSSGMFSKRPELKEQLAAPFESQISDRSGKFIFLHQLFVTPGGRSFFHSEVGGNLFRQIAGRKTWTLVPPSYTHWLCPFLVGEFVALQTCVQSFEPNLREEWFKRLPRFVGTLEPGDMIYNPPWYWHDIVAHGGDSQQASVAGRIGLRRQSFQNGLAQSLLIIRKQLRLQAKLKAKAIGGDMTTVDYNQILEEFIVDSWIEGCHAEGRDDCHGLMDVRSVA